MSAKPVPRCIGLLGGSFDPVHVAHVALARAARHALAADEVRLIPAAAPWQRAPLATPAEHRAAMAELAVAGIEGLAVDRIEIDRGGPSYTVDTLAALAAREPGARLVWILGADQLANFCTWHDWQGVVRLAELAVAARPGSPLEAPAALAECLAGLQRPLHRLDMPEMPVSASDIRARLARGESADGLVPSAVLRYIQQHRLYQN